MRPPDRTTLFPYTTLFRSQDAQPLGEVWFGEQFGCAEVMLRAAENPGIVERPASDAHARSEEHTSELQSRLHLVCRLLLEKKKDRKLASGCCLLTLT